MRRSRFDYYFNQPSDRQSKENVRRCQSLIRNAGYADDLKLESQSILHFKNGSRIVGLPGGRPENIRGYSKVSLIVADEAAFIDDETFAAVFPFLATNPHAVFIALTTPNGARGWFYRQWAEENNWRKIRVTSEMCERISPEFLEQQPRIRSVSVCGRIRM